MCGWEESYHTVDGVVVNIKNYSFLFLLAIKEKDTTPPSQVNPAMFLILIVMALMFIIICVVLRLFSK